MDPLLTPGMITAALTKLLDSAAAEAGSKAWEGLKALITRHRGTAPAQPASAEEVSALADELVADAAKDASFARDLEAWHQSVAGSDNTVNIVGGDVWRLVQGRDFDNTTITFN